MFAFVLFKNYAIKVSVIYLKLYKVLNINFCIKWLIFNSFSLPRENLYLILIFKVMNLK